MKAKKKKYGVFLSYSREDKNLIATISYLIQAIRDDLVFLDHLSIEPGQRWMDKLFEALNEVQIVLVFWCKHSTTSGFVRDEYRFAMRQGKILIPILLDSTKLDEELTDYQYINFIGIVSHQIDLERIEHVNQDIDILQLNSEIEGMANGIVTIINKILPRS